MPEVDPRIARLAEAHGISTEFWDWKGHHRKPEEETLIACLAAMGVDTTSEGWIDDAFRQVEEADWMKPLPPCVVVEQGQERTVNVHVASGAPAHVWVRLEDGATTQLDQTENNEPDKMIDGQMIGRASFRLPTNVAPGYHTLFLESDDQSFEASYIVTPSWLGVPDLEAGSVWGFMAQLYSVCGHSSWGVGDFSDLEDLAVWAATKHNADFILINPTHADQVSGHMEPSPYFPSTRRYVNPIYIRPEGVEEYATGPDEVRDVVQQLRRQSLTAMHTSPEINRDAVWKVKKQALKTIFGLTRRPGRQMEFDSYLAEQGERLKRYATWCVLTEVHGHNWRRWPDEFRDPESSEVALFAEEYADEVMFYMWLQWIATLQAARAHATALKTGMKIGVMGDLAVGVNRDGAETWSMQNYFAPGVTVGAPPDAYNQAGQDWRQPPWRPDKLREASYAPFRDMISSMLGSTGALRIDHIIGLFRLWWIPDSMTPDAGAYVRYDHEAMVGILALEAQRAKTIIVGEDLGTVEPWAREYLARRGIFGTSVLWFENEPGGGPPLNPEQWRQLCLGSVTTHDLPPTLGYLAHDHVALRYGLGLLTESLEEEIHRDAAEQAAVLKLLMNRGLIAQGESDPHAILLGLHRFLYQTPTKLKCVALTDVVGERRTQNQPGTIDEYPNWRIPLGDESGHRLYLEEIFALPGVNDVTEIMNGRA